MFYYMSHRSIGQIYFLGPSAKVEKLVHERLSVERSNSLTNKLQDHQRIGSVNQSRDIVKL